MLSWLLCLQGNLGELKVKVTDSQGVTLWLRERITLYNSASSSQNLKEALSFWEHRDLNSLYLRSASLCHILAFTQLFMAMSQQPDYGKD